MAKKICSFLLLLGVLVRFGSGVVPAGTQPDPWDSINCDLSQQPIKNKEDSAPAAQLVKTSEPDVSLKFSTFPTRIKYFVWKSSEAGIELVGDAAEKALALRVQYMNEFKANLKIYQAELDALSGDTGTSRIKVKQDTKPGRSNAELISRLVENSKIQFSRDAKLTDGYEIIEVGRPEALGSCKNPEPLLERKHGGSVVALETFGTCVRLFKEKGCAADSFAVYPGHTLNLSQILPEINSIGPCFKQEFDYSNITQTPQGLLHAVKDTGNHREIPSTLTGMKSDSCGQEAATKQFEKFMYSPDTASFIVPDCSSRPSMFIKSVKLGEVIFQDLSSSYLSETWKSLEKESGDIMGFFMPPCLGGCTADPANIFPQSLENFDAWNKVTDRFVEYLVRNPSRSGSLLGTLVYPNKETKRPHGLYWTFNLQRFTFSWLDSAPWTAYGYIPN